MIESRQLPSEILKEFLKTSISIEVLETSYLNGDLVSKVGDEKNIDSIINEKFFEHDFELIWNDQFVVHSNNYYNEPQGYKEFLNNKTNEFRDSISLIPKLKIPPIEKFELLIKFRTDLSSSINQFLIEKNEYGGFFHDYLTTKNIIKNYSSKEKISEDRVKQIIHSFLSLQKKFLSDLINYVDKYLEVFKTVGFSKTEENINNPEEKKTDRARPTKTNHLKNKSLQFESINPNEFDEMLQNFQKVLERNGFIEPMDYRVFKKVFTNQVIDKPIFWLVKPNELYYLLKSLHEKGGIKKIKNYWQVACSCFILKDGSGRKLTPDYLSHCKAPKLGSKLRLLKSIIDPLIKQKFLT